MASYEESISYDMPHFVISAACEAVLADADQYKWTIKKLSHYHFIYRMPRTLSTNPSTIEVKLEDGGPSTKVIVHGSCAGWGPLNARVVRGDVEAFVDKLNPVVQRIDEELRFEMLKEGLMCPTCGQPLVAGTLFCPNDGTPIGRPCTSCGYRNKPRDAYCIKCGTAL